MRIVELSDFSFENCEDYETQLGYIILLTDKLKRINWLSYASYRCIIVVRAVLVKATYAIAEYFDAAYILKHDLERMLNKKVQITLLTDSEILFNIIVKSTTTTEKRWNIDVRAARQVFENKEMFNIGWIRSAEKAVDGLTKLKQCRTLENSLTTGALHTQVELWRERVTADRRKHENNSSLQNSSQSVNDIQ